ncbi:MAG TPA: ABC transporter permease, partial [Gemmatimonadaceae bacterium]|nr:ABC transporter permease [Gemmatimonadaceae bacterium]
MNPISFLTQMIRIAVPYLFAASGGVIAERSGIISLSLEGYMLTGAFSATLGAHYSGSAWIGVLAGMFGGLVFGLLHAIASIRYKADQVVTGIAINLLAIGVTRFFLKLAFASSSNSPRIEGFGGNNALHGFDNPLLWLGLLTAPVLAFLLYRTPYGLRVR